MHPFDELTKGLAFEAISRRKALLAAGGAALSAALVPFAAPAEAGRRRRNRCRNKPNLCTGSKASICRETPELVCACMKREDNGKKVCVNLGNAECPKSDECGRNRPCPGNRVCVQLGGACCTKVPATRNLCVPRCPRG